MGSGNTRSALSEALCQLFLNFIVKFSDGDQFEKWSSVLLKVILVHFRVKFYKTVGNTSVLSAVGSMDSMCGDALKLLFKYRGKVYLKASQGEIFL